MVPVIWGEGGEGVEMVLDAIQINMAKSISAIRPGRNSARPACLCNMCDFPDSQSLPVELCLCLPIMSN